MRQQNFRFDGMSAVGWTALAIVCTYALAQIDLRRGGIYDAFDKVELWIWVGRLLLAICLFHIVAHLIQTIREFARNAIKSRRIDTESEATSILQSIVANADRHRPETVAAAEAELRFRKKFSVDAAITL